MDRLWTGMICRRCLSFMQNQWQTIRPSPGGRMFLSSLSGNFPGGVKPMGARLNLCREKLLSQEQWLNHLSFQPSRLLLSQSSKPKDTFRLGWWQRLVIVGGFVGVGCYNYYRAQWEKEVEGECLRYKEFKKAKLGGDWQLTDHHGNKTSSSTFRGQWLLIYFGFTHCPDICPEELEKLSRLVKMIDEDPVLPSMQPLFVSLDPERDSPAVVKDYLKEFKMPQMVGFTGTLDEIRVVAKQFRAYFGKGPADEDNDYIVDHTIIIYLINPDGEFVNYFDRSNSAEKIKNTVSNHVRLYNEIQRRKS